MIERLKINDIIVDLSINTLPQLDETVVEAYKEAITDYGVDRWMYEWLEKPKITTDKHLWSGFHTIEAAIRAFGAEQEIYFEVEGESRDEALLLATGENSKRGRKRSNKEKQVSVLRWLHDKKGRRWANSYIATQCNVSDGFVRSVVENLTSNIRSEIYDENYKRPTKLKYINKHGKQAVMETKDIGNNAALDAELRQRCIDEFKERLLLKSSIPWINITDHESEIDTGVYTDEDVQELLIASNLKSRYNMAQTEVDSFVKAVEQSVLEAVDTDRKTLIKKVDALFQKALENDFGRFGNYTEFVKSIEYYQDNETDQDEILAVFCQVEVTDTQMNKEGFEVHEFERWISLLTRYHRDFEYMFSPKPDSCKWELHRIFEKTGQLTGETVDVDALAEENNLTPDKVRSLVYEVLTEAQQDNIETIHTYLKNINNALVWITEKFTHIRESNDPETIQQTATYILEYTNIADIATKLVKEAQQLAAEENTDEVKVGE